LSWSGSGVAGFGDTTDSSSGPSPISSAANSIAADTIGAVWRGLSGSVDPWTQSELDDTNAQAMVQASNGTLSYDDALSQIQETSAEVAASQHVSWSDAAKTWVGNTFTDNGTGCSLITNPAGCYPSWLPYVAIGAVALLVLWVLRPYVIAAEE